MRVVQLSFRFLVIAILIVSTVIDEVIVMAILFGVVDKGNQSLSIAVLLLVQLVPTIILAPYGGYAVDRYGARRVLMLTGLLEIPVLFALSYSTSISQVYLLSGIMSGLFAFSGPAIFSLIPSASQRAGMSVERANSLIEVVGGLGAIAGPVVGGLSVGSLPLSTLIQVTAAWSLFLVAIIYLSDLDSPRSQEKEKLANLLTQFRISYKPILRLGQVRFLYITFFCIVYSTTFSDVIFVFFVLRDLQGGPLEVGILIGLWSAGLTVGAWYLGSKKDPRSVIRFAYIGAVTMGLSLVLTGIVPGALSPWHATLAVGAIFVIGGVGNGIHNVAVRDAIFVYVPAGQHGRAFSLYSLVTRVAAVLGYFSGGLAGDQNAQSVYLLSGFLALAFGSLGLATMGRILDQKHTAS